MLWDDSTRRFIIMGGDYRGVRFHHEWFNGERVGHASSADLQDDESAHVS